MRALSRAQLRLWPRAVHRKRLWTESVNRPPHASRRAYPSAHLPKRWLIPRPVLIGVKAISSICFLFQPLLKACPTSPALRSLDHVWNFPGCTLLCSMTRTVSQLRTYNAFITSVILNGASWWEKKKKEEVPHLKPVNKNNLNNSLARTVSVQQ